MKPCNHCSNQIHDSAKKCEHCHSFQNPADEPKKNLDTANLVISLIGVITIGFAIIGGLFGFLGYQSMEDFRKTSSEIKQKNEEVIKTFEGKSNELTVKFNQSHEILNEYRVSELARRAEDLFDRVTIDRLSGFPKLLEELTKIKDQAKKIEPLSPAGQDIKTQLIMALEALDSYNEKEYDKVLATVKTLPDENFWKNRLISNTYVRLHEKAKRDKDEANAEKYLRKAQEKAIDYNDLVTSLADKSYIGKFNLAAILILESKYSEAREILVKLLVENPLDGDLHYNLAAIDVQESKLKDALERLEHLKGMGFFKQNEVKEFFLTDPSFEPLRQNPDKEIKKRLKKLLQG